MSVEPYSVVLISGKQGSGKSTLADGLMVELQELGCHVERLKFADPLYAFHNAIRMILHEDGMDDIPGVDGPLLQVLGTEWGRKTRGEDFWVRYAQKRVKTLFQKNVEMGIVRAQTIFLFDDCRFPNELTAFENAISIRLEAAEDVRKERAAKWRPNTTHPSEIALDHANFDLVLPTEQKSCEETLARALEYISRRIQ